MNFKTEKAKEQMLSDSTVRLARIATWTIIASLFVIQMWIRSASSLVHDTSWFFNMVEQMQQGKRLYVDLIEVNPPLGIWLTWPIVRLSQITRWSDVNILYASLLILTALSLLWSNRVLARAQTLSCHSRHLLILLLAIFLLFYPGPNFAEREHFIIIAFMPWLLLRATSAAPQRLHQFERMAIGISAGIAICVKPQSLAAPVAVELLLLASTRDWRNTLRSENLSALAAITVYIFLVTLITPDYLRSMVELGRIAYYPYYGYPFWVILLYISAAIAAFGFGLLLRPTLPPAEKQVMGVMLAAAAGFIVSYLIQNKGFTYQAIPADIIALAAAAWAFARPEWKVDAATFLRGGITAIVGFALFSGQQLYYPDDAALRQAVREYSPDAKSVFLASTRVSDAFPAVREMKLTWASTLPTQWFAPYVAAHGGEGASSADAIVHLARRTVVADMKRWLPELVLVDEGKEQSFISSGSFDHVAFWSADPEFAALWKGYERRGTVETFAVYTRKK